MQGVRIDYVLVSPGLLPKMGKCQIIQTPSKWSDHAAVMATVKDLSPPVTHAPVPESSKRMKKFDTRSQPTIASMFARRPSNKASKPIEPESKLSHPKASDSSTAGIGNRIDSTPTSEPQNVQGDSGTRSISQVPDMSAAPLTTLSLLCRHVTLASNRF